MNYKTSKMPPSYCNLSFDSSILNWDEAIPLGNGLTGCLIWGDGSPLHFSLDRGDLWDKRSAPETLSKNFTYKRLIELVKNKDQKRIREIFDKCYNRATPTKIPAGKIQIDFNEEISDIKSHLFIKNATAEIIIVNEKSKSIIRTFLHAAKNIGYIQIIGCKSVRDVRIKAPEFGILSDTESEENEVEKNISNGSLKKLKYPPVEYEERCNLKWFIQKTAEDLEYGIFTAQSIRENELNIVYSIGSNVEGVNWIDNAKKNVQNALNLGFDEMLKEHEYWWTCFWEQSSIGLPDKDLEKMWYLTNYFFGACSRKNAPPMPLQGVWTADDGQLPPWKGDYHHDLNTQFSYLHYLKANHIEEGESFIDFLWRSVPTARQFARDFFDAPGLCLPSVMTIDGKPLGGWPMYSLNLTNQIWLCQLFHRHWECTGDISFLEQKVYPYFKETALCVLRWLEPNSNGELYLPLSSSPEIHDDDLAAWLTPNSNYDLALLIYLFKTLYHMAEKLGYDEKRNWEDRLNLLPDLAINVKHVLMLSPDETLNESHRHHGHTMAIFPLDLLNYHLGGRDKRIIDKTIHQLEILGKGLWVGFSFTWMAELYARQCNGEGAAFQLKLFWENLCSQNGFHLNGDYQKRGLTQWHYRPFTLESNMCAADALQEMLLQTYDNVIRVFPAIPQSWAKEGVSFSTLRGMKGILISSTINNSELEYIQLKAQHAGNYFINNRFNSEKLIIKRQNKDESIICKHNKNFSISIEKDEVCSIYSRKR